VVPLSHGLSTSPLVRVILRVVLFPALISSPIGTSIGLNLRDSSGLVAQSAPFTINSGSKFLFTPLTLCRDVHPLSADSSCVGKTPSSSAGSATTAAGGSSGAPASGGAPATGTTPATTPATIATSPIATTPLAYDIL
jgi:hypothetical protein